MARAASPARRAAFTALAWTLALLIFFPIAWTILTSFKTERDAIANPPVLVPLVGGADGRPPILAGEADDPAEDATGGPEAGARSPGGPFFRATLENYRVVQERSDYMRFLWNSVVIAGGSTLLGILVAVPAAWSMAFVPSRRTKDVLLWMLSTKMLPAVGVLYPIYLIATFRLPLGGGTFQLIDTKPFLVVILMLINLPIIVWMLYTYFREIPGEILEAARMDGASLRAEIVHVLTPMAVPGIASTVLLSFILAWNEAFWTLNLTAVDAAPLTAFIASYSSPEGLFFAKLSAASTMAIAPILVLGWFAQKQLVRGLTFGAVK
ncbi:sorbitol ABC transporter membrane protein /mannitol ABC transporter membrane protein [Hasllibacter halocynthiae]|uniref:Sorbitol ABC transporter membrane protein /mannitol ABC transporter membrane protein n=1 Tax=Hasllibacter halocynthiae TaxID=595589 RepID=A0A2T0WZ92_9RHOB|nr:carbohydrate ABC transporter permease [Hasllibacter halocynthiae]PRY92018.1 sorbitol ABC transporter membrane protein /mannitol ABC transporter membrane protein [Hasllibacter halocynthiae]